LSWVLLADVTEGFAWAIVGGIMQDLLNGLPTGTTALALVAVAFMVNAVVGVVDRHNLVIPPLAMLAGTVLYQLILVVLLAVLTGRALAIGYTITSITLPTLIYNVILTLPVFRLMGLVYEASRPRRVTL
jgi:rod shape-determining protein MreD